MNNDKIEDIPDAVLLQARGMFCMLKEILNAQSLPTGDQEISIDEIEVELDRIDLEILARGLISPEES